MDSIHGHSNTHAQKTLFFNVFYIQVTKGKLIMTKNFLYMILVLFSSL